MQRLRFLAALWAGKLAALAIRLLARGRGTNLPGSLALKIDPLFLQHLRGTDPARTVFVTGTNGKSTTTNLLAHMFERAGYRLAVNRQGANLTPGIATSLIAHTSPFGRVRADLILMEADERFLPITAGQLRPGHLCVTNLQKDQVQRNGAPDIIYDKLRQVIRRDTVLYLNNEEPSAGSLRALAERTVTFGVEQNDKSFQKPGPLTTTVPCPFCSQPIRFDVYNVDNVGPFCCTGCGYASSPRPDCLVADVDYENGRFSVDGDPYPFGYATPYFLYCYSAAVAIARAFGLPPAVIASACADFVNIGGRFERFALGDKTVQYIRMKQENPETLQSAINHIAADPAPKIVVLGLGEIRDDYPYYTNTFYTYDCDFERLEASEVTRYLCFSDTVCYDSAIRLRYAGVPEERICIVPSNDGREVLRALDRQQGSNVYLITLLRVFEELVAAAKGLAGAAEG
ncbi:MAG: DUF1727 domain-containing protein [Clostridiales bacterium]|nr:DUF1727 domain-containing protein [Clostridiales bacterium]